MKIPYFAIPAPDDLNALMSADRDIVARHPGLAVYCRKLFAADELHAPEGFNAVRVAVLGPGLRVRQLIGLTEMNLEQDGVVYEESDA
jgi:hypothetical protein